MDIQLYYTVTGIPTCSTLVVYNCYTNYPKYSCKYSPLYLGIYVVLEIQEKNEDIQKRAKFNFL